MNGRTFFSFAWCTFEVRTVFTFRFSALIDRHFVVFIFSFRFVNFRPVDVTEIRASYRKGGLYSHGRDDEFRPILVMDVGIVNDTMHVDDALRTMIFLIDWCLDYVLTPGKVEQWVVIVDTRGTSVWRTPFRFLQVALPLLSSKYRARMHRIYVLGIPSYASFVVNKLQELVDHGTGKKVVVMDDVEPGCELDYDVA